ncbi:NADPH-dependent FMN reductase [Allokutzneria oryzae]|uniref:NADPH-dependent FMN reductase n=1 Tax=Allokutzneria oryzae TaxID=1378989 RepID=A0ABV6A5L9_9PSEU
MPKLNVIVASNRPGRSGRTVADWFVPIAEQHGGFEVVLADLAEIGLPFLDEPEHPASGRYTHQHTKDWSALNAAADAFVFVMPEYNFGFTAPLKNAIDYLYQEWRYKPVGFVSYGMTSGGLRAVQMIKQVVTTLKMTPATEAVTVFLRQHLAEDGTVRADPALAESAVAMLDELGRLSSALAPLRSADS